MAPEPRTRLDQRFSEPGADPTGWPETEQLLAAAPLYWLTTVRADGRPHVTPLVGLWHEGAFHFCTGVTEQKWRNLTSNPEVCVTTGSSDWDRGTDVVVEGAATRLTGQATLQPLADAWFDKYGDDWRFDATDDGFGHDDQAAEVFRVEPAKVLAFAKRPHGQTAHRFSKTGTTAS